MLDRLPTELLTTIVRLAAPTTLTPGASPNAYLERHRTLKSCCLMFRRLCAIAQPMLPEVLELMSEDDVKAMREAEVDGALVEHMVVRGGGSEIPFAATALGLCTNLVSLRLVNLGPVDLLCLDGMSRLTHLAVHDAHFSHSSAPFLPSLQSISLSLVEIDETALGGLLSTPATPNLCHLALCGIRPPSEEVLHSTAALFQSVLSPMLVERLDTLMLDTLDPFPLAFAFAPSTFVLVDCPLTSGLEALLREFPFRLPPHLSLNFPSDESVVLDEEADPDAAADAADCLDELAERIADPSLSNAQQTVKLVVLPSFAQTEYPTDGVIDCAIKRLVAACERRGVEVRWEEQPERTQGSVLTEWMCERGSRMREEREKVQRESEELK
ncbi:hypothetical protein JCM6882_001814 [Rhodosporidiobolus microsporus]